MNPGFEQYLVQKFPDLFEAKPDFRYNGMAFGFQCGHGWFNILNRLCVAISAELAKRPAGERFTVTQVKEKYGTLRFYTNWETDRIGRLIRAAENLSAQTCERCGAPGKTGGTGWLSTLCDTCRIRGGTP